MSPLLNTLIATALLCFLASLVVLGSDVLATSHNDGVQRDGKVKLDDKIDPRESSPLAEADTVDLSEALSLAESHAHGTVLDADLKAHQGHNAWDVVMIEDGTKFRVWVDARNGSVQVQR